MFRLPLKQKFRGLKFREGVVFRGTHGWGEFAPFHDHSDRHAANWLKAALEMAFAHRVETEVDCVRSNAIVPECDQDQASTWAALGDCQTAKVKVSGDALFRRQDLDRLWSVSKTLGVNGKLRIDFNGACSVANAVDFANDCKGLPIEYFEQPCTTLEECAQLRDEIDYPIAVDESIRLNEISDLADAASAIQNSADVAVLKPIPLGGMKSTQQWATRLAMPCVISSSLDTSVGLSYVAKVAAKISPDAVHGLGTGVLFASDLVRYPLLPHDGEIHVGAVEPDLVSLERASGETHGAIEDKWQMRMARCWQELALDPILESVAT